MAGTAADRGTEHARVRAKEQNNYSGGKSMAKVPVKLGPAYGGRGIGGNATKGGGINRSTRGLG